MRPWRNIRPMKHRRIDVNPEFQIFVPPSKRRIRDIFDFNLFRSWGNKYKISGAWPNVWVKWPQKLYHGLWHSMYELQVILILSRLLLLLIFHADSEALRVASTEWKIFYWFPRIHTISLFGFFTYRIIIVKNTFVNIHRKRE